jgi:GT2 family glycosyltransferase
VDISIIIVNYNVREFLRSAILSVQRSLAHGKIDGEIFVVDNNSSDGSVEMIRSEFPEVRLYALEENIGFGRANNLAMRISAGEYMLILNPDTILGEDTLEVMIRFMREHPESGLAGCKLLNGDGSFQLSCRRGFPTPWASFTKLFGLSGIFPNSSLFARYNLTYLPVDATYEVDALGGAFMMMSRTAFHATGGFDESFFMYGEDLDLCFQVKKQGFKVFYVHETATIHFKGESTRRSAVNEVKLFYEAMHIFVKKNYKASLFFSSILRIGIALRTVFAVVKKHRGACFLMLLDVLTVAFSVLLASKFILGHWLGLPPEDYPFALVAPPLIVVLVLLGIGAYKLDTRRRLKEILLALPVELVFLSSLTYFFKEYASSRSLVISIAAVATVLLSLDRWGMRVFDRIRFGGEKSAKPAMKRTLVAGTTAEAVRIANLLQRTQFTRHYQLVGFTDATLERLGQELLPTAPILGDTEMMAKIVRDERISEVVFANDSLPYTEMLGIMQRISDENPSRIVNFNVVPTATDILLGKRKIEVLRTLEAVPENNVEPISLMPVQFNIQRFSHRTIKRTIDVILAPLLMLFGLIRKSLRPGERSEVFMKKARGVLHGELSIVGIELANRAHIGLSKSGMTSLAKITLRSVADASTEDVEQLDLYYAQNHTLGMDLEIMLRSLAGKGNSSH